MTVYFGLCCMLSFMHGVDGLTFLVPPAPHTVLELDEGPADLHFPVYLLQTDSSNTIFYDIIIQTPDLVFRASNTAGFIFQFFDLDYEGPHSAYLLTILASDQSSPTVTATTTLQIKVLDVNEHPVLTGPFTGTVDENMPIGTTVSTTYTAYDDEDGTSITYTTIGLDTSKVQIGYHTGIITTARIFDYESETSFSFYIRVYDTTNLDSRTELFTVYINDLNDNSPPTFSSSTYHVTVAENTASGQSIGRVTASDPDSGDTLTISIQTGTSKYVMDSNVIRTTSTPIDYESMAGSSFVETLVIVVNDGVLTATTTVSVTVTGVNEFTPAWTAFTPAYVGATTPYTVNENSPSGTSIVTIAASDSDLGTDGQIAYSLTDPAIANNADSVSGLFQVDPSNGELSTTSTPLDVDGGYTYFDVTVSATDQGSPALSATRVIRISMNDLNDVSPACSQSPFTATVSENVANGHTVLTIAAPDGDINSPNNDVTYAVSGGSGSALFVVGSSTGLVTTSGSFDYESGAISYQIKITAQDGGSPTLSTTCTVQVTIDDLNDNTPSFSSGSITHSVSEASSIGDTIITVPATDADSSNNNNNVIVYSFSPTSSEFNIGSSDGSVTLAATLDREMVDRYTLTVLAIDQGTPQNTASTTLTVSILDANDNTPVFNSASYSYTILETTPTSTSVGQVQASDGDIGTNAHITFHIASADIGNSAHFNIQSSSGVISTAAVLDRESIDTYELVVTATDAGSSPRTGSTTVTIDLSDVNDNNPAFNSASYSASTNENESIGTSILTVTITDPDIGVNSDIVLSIDTSDPGGLNADTYIQVDSMTSRLTVKQVIDRENEPSFTFPLIATDQGSPARSSSVVVTITVTDVNDNNPVFSSSSYMFNISESSSISTTFGQVVATDSDAGTNAQIVYSIDSANIGDSSHFTIDTSTGDIETSTNLDRETTSTYEFILSATDGGSSPRSDTTTVTIYIDDVNDNTPTFTAASYSASTVENLSIGTSILTVTTTDPDIGSNSDIILSIDTSDPGGLNANTYIQVDSMTSQLTVKQVIDRENDPSFTFPLIATDQGSPARSSSVVVTITVTDVNDNNPVFSSSSYMFNFSESSSISTSFGQVVATDSDAGTNAQIVYAIDSANIGDSSHFTIDTSTGDIETSTNLDRETTSTYEFILSATDGGSSPRSDTTTVTIYIDDVNDNTPVFNSASYSYTILETTPTSTSVGQVQASDGDIGTNAHITFHIASADIGNSAHFNIQSSSGVISTAAVLDRESIDTYELVVMATDAGSSPRTGSTTVTIDLSDVNDNNPAFNSASYSASTNENESIGTSILTVTITDPDIGVNSDIVLSIDTSDPGGLNADTYIQVDSMTSRLTVKQVIDRENEPSFTFPLIATDQGSPARSSSVVVTITVTDVNDNNPVFSSSSYMFNISESSSISTTFGQVVATDSDAGTNAQIVYAIDSANIGDSSHFTIDTSTGDIETSTNLDRETTSTYEFILSATDGGSSPRSDTTTVTIYIDDVNDNTPTFTAASYSASTVENLSIGTSILTVTTTDPDIGSNSDIVLSIDTSDPGGLNANTYIQVDSVTSRLTVKQVIDRENNPSFTFPLIATDQGSPARSSSVVVTITVTDINDNNPVFSSSSYMFNISESSSISTTFGQVVATDSDAGTNAQIVYSIDSANIGDSSHFTIDTSTGDIETSTNLDRETTSTYEFILSATDGGSSPRSDTTTVTIYIDDVNDNTPTFTAASYSASTVENLSIGTSILIVTTTDPDIGSNSDIVLSIDTSDPGGLNADTYIQVDSVTSQLTVKQVIDRENDPSFTFPLIATDQGSPARSSSVVVTITVTDINDNNPVFSSSSYMFNISESSSISTTFGQVVATDSDAGTNAQIVYAIDSANIGDSSHFTIDTSTGDIETSTNLDRETTSTYEFILSATDGDSSPRSDTTTVTIYIDDVNDNTPTFTAASYSASTVENQPIGTTILTVTITDIDLGVNSDVVFNIDTSTPDGLNADTFLQIDSLTSQLSVKQVIDREIDSIFNFTLVATDQGTPPLSSSVSISIDVIDVNDNSPIFSQLSYLINVSETVTVSSAVGSVSATDSDDGVNSQITFSIDSFNTGNDTHFKINSTNGIMETSAVIDRETEDTYEIVIIAVDGGTSPLTGTCTFIVYITDYNDNIPTLSANSYTASVTENDVVGTSILSVAATDADIGVNADIVLTIDTSTAAGTRADLFININSTTSEMSIKQVIDREADDFFAFTLVATDQGIPALSSTALINISVTDVNDNLPVFSPSFYSTEIAYNDDCQFTITTVTATDADLGTNGDTSLTTSRPYNSTVFAFNATTGDVTVINTTDKDSMYLMYINATDAASPPLTTEAVVRIDTYDPPDVILNYHMDINCSEYVSLESTFLSQLTEVYNLTYPTCTVGRWCVAKGSDNSSCIVRVYVIVNDTADELHELNNTKYFLGVNDAFGITAADAAGTPADVITGPSWGAFAITKVEKYGRVGSQDDDSSSWAESAAGIGVISGLSLTGLFGVAAVMSRVFSSPFAGGGGLLPQQNEAESDDSYTESQTSLQSGSSSDSMPRVSVNENFTDNSNPFRAQVNEQTTGYSGFGGPRIVTVQPRTTI